MKGVPVRLDVLNHYPEPGFLHGQVLPFGEFPQGFVTACAIGLWQVAFPMRHLGVDDVHVTIDARHVAVHTF